MLTFEHPLLTLRNENNKTVPVGVVSVQQGPRLSLTGISGVYSVKLYLKQKEHSSHLGDRAGPQRVCLVFLKVMKPCKTI